MRRRSYTLYGDTWALAVRFSELNSFTDTGKGTGFIRSQLCRPPSSAGALRFEILVKARINMTFGQGYQSKSMKGGLKFSWLDLLWWCLLRWHTSIVWTRLAAWQAWHSLVLHCWRVRHLDDGIDAQKERRDVIGLGKDVSCQLKRGKVPSLKDESRRPLYYRVKDTSRVSIFGGLVTKWGILISVGIKSEA